MISYIAYVDFALKIYCSTKFEPWVSCGFGANPDTNFELLNYIYRYISVVRGRGTVF